MFRLDKCITLSPKRGRRAGPLAEVEGAYCLRLVATALLITFIGISTSVNANAYPLKRFQQEWVLQAMNHLVSLEESQCWVELIWKESTFNPNAKNGSHYGLAQMRNEKVKRLSAKKQVNWHMRYLDHRYSGSACKALDHFYSRGWH